jgi:hypothetical protein
MYGIPYGYRPYDSFWLIAAAAAAAKVPYLIFRGFRIK